MQTWTGLIIALVATSIMNFGLALQKRGAAGLPKIGREKGAGKALFTNRIWLAGTFGLVFGWGMYLYSTKLAPISLIQPALGMGIVVLALFSVLYLKESIRMWEWISLFGMITGMILLGLSASEETSAALPEWGPLLIITGIIVMFSLGVYLLGMRGRLTGVRTDAMLGIVAGLFVGLGAIYMRAMFVLVDEGHTMQGYGVCLPVFIFSFIFGIAVVQSGFQHGKALIVVALEAVLNKVVAIVGGMLALGEHLPRDPVLAGMRVCAFVLILSGSAVLSRFGKEKIDKDAEACLHA